ncbi:hypothetical protein [Microseira wollei]|uniref:hypothetical protein n=1 Tax=Microseira wollei TaxID=467598 RepID=UPI001CFEF608|nr:hypothetical protein [Microseira wollei]
MADVAAERKPGELGEITDYTGGLTKKTGGSKDAGTRGILQDLSASPRLPLSLVPINSPPSVAAGLTKKTGGSKDAGTRGILQDLSASPRLPLSLVLFKMQL